MSALFRSTGDAFFIRNFRSSSRSQSIERIATRYNSHSVQRSVVISRPIGSIGCPATQQGTFHYLKTSSRLLSNAKPNESDLSKEVERELNLLQNEAQQSKNDVNQEFLQPIFKKGDSVMAEVIYFGPLGASVDIVAHNSHDPSDCIPPEEPALGRGMILQREINYFRRGRGDVDVVKFEVLPAYVENTREEMNEDGEVEVRLDISLRPPGGKAKAEELGEQILRKLKTSDGVLEVGDKSSPEEINGVFPGASKSAFKKAVSGLYRRGLVSPGPKSISLM
eukprot:CAMPEP_0172552966 /NCGR_PEP_ID=MMETSP1067-20121228/47533_1 /TAXON_ID=265564 ORGANISM="Thalassiosira punctigera, Strain Tpunct2005C2" /NCGR_SAMPLE_ID=MMETSP1067 /ASSEMBLY_ACC=CAM_ASM_000444 /LENGTH=279 /DNA_ID=CAMNT_0013341049 /DNA_START=45 /DNA_END=884 /DNA_ORIENTATION=+